MRVGSADMYGEPRAACRVSVLSCAFLCVCARACARVCLCVLESPVGPLALALARRG